MRGGLTLPQFAPLADPVFTRSSHNSESFTADLNAAYGEAVYWKMSGKARKSFVFELTLLLYKAFATGSSLESIALKAATVMPILLLQKPTQNSKAKNHSACCEGLMVTYINSSGSGELSNSAFL